MLLGQTHGINNTTPTIGLTSAAAVYFFFSVVLTKSLRAIARNNEDTQRKETQTQQAQKVNIRTHRAYRTLALSVHTCKRFNHQAAKVIGRNAYVCVYNAIFVV